MTETKQIWDYSHKQSCRYCEGRGKQVDFEALGAEIRKKRLENGVTIAIVAQELGVSSPYISGLERGKRPCSIGRVDQILRIIKKNKVKSRKR